MIGSGKRKTIVVATPHHRNDELVANLGIRLAGSSVIRITTRETLSVDCLKKVAPEIIFFPHWSWIIPAEIYENFECVIFHMTDLPYGRGGSPLQNLIIRGHKETKVSAIRCVAGIDAGPVYMKESLSLGGTAEDILLRASSLMEEMIVKMVENPSVPIPQVGEVVEFKRRSPEDGDIAALENLHQVYDYIRMLDAEGYPHAFVLTPHMQLDFTQARLKGDFLEAKVKIRRRIDE